MASGAALAWPGVNTRYLAAHRYEASGRRLSCLNGTNLSQELQFLCPSGYGAKPPDPAVLKHPSETRQRHRNMSDVEEEGRKGPNRSTMHPQAAGEAARGTSPIALPLRYWMRSESTQKAALLLSSHATLEKMGASSPCI